MLGPHVTCRPHRKTRRAAKAILQELRLYQGHLVAPSYLPKGFPSKADTTYTERIKERRKKRLLE